MWYTEVMAQPFTTPRDNPGNDSFSPSASYLRNNIAVPANSSKTAAAHALQADTDYEDRLPSGATVASLPTPQSGG
jgi:hypothetical protein